MRAVLTLTAAALLTASTTGCALMEWMRGKDHAQQQQPPQHTGPIQPVAADQLVGYLNRQAGYLTSIRYPDVAISVTGPKPDNPNRTETNTLNSSTLICAKPRNFLLVGGKGVVGDLVHIGSNDQEFWLRTLSPLPQEYVFCSHADFATGRASLPIPFEPDWALQALGMATYDPSAAYKVEVDARTREHVLSFDGKTPQGQPVKKVVVFAADPAGGTQPQVRRHLVVDAAGKTIASAEVATVTTLPAGVADPQGRPAHVQVPTRVLLKWPQQKFEMDLRLRGATVNDPIPDAEARQLFTRPTGRGMNPINLAEARFTPSGLRGATPANDRPSRPFGRR